MKTLLLVLILILANYTSKANEILPKHENGARYDSAAVAFRMLDFVRDEQATRYNKTSLDAAKVKIFSKMGIKQKRKKGVLQMC